MNRDHWRDGKLSESKKQEIIKLVKEFYTYNMTVNDFAKLKGISGSHMAYYIRMVKDNYPEIIPQPPYISEKHANMPMDELKHRLALSQHHSDLELSKDLILKYFNTDINSHVFCDQLDISSSRLEYHLDIVKNAYPNLKLPKRRPMSSISKHNKPKLKNIPHNDDSHIDKRLHVIEFLESGLTRDAWGRFKNIHYDSLFNDICFVQYYYPDDIKDINAKPAILLNGEKINIEDIDFSKLSIEDIKQVIMNTKHHSYEIKENIIKQILNLYIQADIGYKEFCELYDIGYNTIRNYIKYMKNKFPDINYTKMYICDSYQEEDIEEEKDLMDEEESNNITFVEVEIIDDIHEDNQNISDKLIHLEKEEELCMHDEECNKLEKPVILIESKGVQVIIDSDYPINKLIELIKGLENNND